MKRQVIARSRADDYANSIVDVRDYLKQGYLVAMANPYYNLDGKPAGVEYILEKNDNEEIQ